MGDELSMIDCQQDCPYPQSPTPINPMNNNNYNKIYNDAGREK
jgi:hypothetical protein